MATKNTYTHRHKSCSFLESPTNILGRWLFIDEGLQLVIPLRSCDKTGDVIPMEICIARPVRLGLALALQCFVGQCMH